VIFPSFSADSKAVNFLKIYITQSKQADRSPNSQDSRSQGLKKQRNTPFPLLSESSHYNPPSDKTRTPAPHNTHSHQPI